MPCSGAEVHGDSHEAAQVLSVIRGRSRSSRSNLLSRGRSRFPQLGLQDARPMNEVEDLGLLLYDRISEMNCLLMPFWESRTRNTASWGSCCSNWIGSLTAFGLRSASGGKLRWGNPSALSLQASSNSPLTVTFLLMPVQDISHIVEVRELTRVIFSLVFGLLSVT